MERPILFSAPMIRAILDGRKTQTRRLLKPQPDGGIQFDARSTHGVLNGNGDNLICRFGGRGDRLFVRETTRDPVRITLEITNVSVERLHDISESDVIAEGIKQYVIDNNDGGYDKDNDVFDDFRHLWESIYGAGAWARNPFVWVIEFKRIEKEEAA